MYCRTKVGNYEGDLGKLVSTYSDKFVKTPIGRSDVEKYGLSGEGYLLFVSKYIGNENRGFIDYNVILTVSGQIESRVNNLIREFESKIPITLREAPKKLAEQNQKMLKLI